MNNNFFEEFDKNEKLNKEKRQKKDNNIVIEKKGTKNIIASIIFLIFGLFAIVMGISIGYYGVSETLYNDTYRVSENIIALGTTIEYGFRALLITIGGISIGTGVYIFSKKN